MQRIECVSCGNNLLPAAKLEQEKRAAKSKKSRKLVKQAVEEVEDFHISNLFKTEGKDKLEKMFEIPLIHVH